jgi:hypothetical membrane protein
MSESPRRTAALAWAGIIGPVLFTVAFLVQEAARRDEYSPMAEPVSALQAGPHGWVQQVSFVVLGVLTLGHAVGLHHSVRSTRGGVLGPALLFLTGVGNIVAGIFPLREDAFGVTYDPGGHVVGGMLFFLGSPAALVVLSLRMRRDPRWRGLSTYTLAAGVALALSAIVMSRLVIPDAAPLHDWAGLAQRLIVLVVLFPCRIAIGLRLLGVARGVAASGDDARLSRSPGSGPGAPVTDPSTT